MNCLLKYANAHYPCLGAHSCHQLLHHACRLPKGVKAPFSGVIMQSNAIVYVFSSSCILISTKRYLTTNDYVFLQKRPQNSRRAARPIHRIHESSQSGPFRPILSRNAQRRVQSPLAKDNRSLRTSHTLGDIQILLRRFLPSFLLPGIDGVPILPSIRLRPPRERYQIPRHRRLEGRMVPIRYRSSYRELRGCEGEFEEILS
jgi:hypothetical protein